MSDQFVGEVRCVGFNFQPKGWAFCNGQLLPISQNTALFSLLGTQFGGDGKSTFALPNLQGSVAIGQGAGAGLSQRFIGEQGGETAVTLLQTEMPAHNHQFMIDSGDAPGNIGSPSPTAAVTVGVPMFTSAATPAVSMATNMLPLAGNSLPHNNLMPFLVMNFVIAMQGIFPARS